MTWFLSWAWSSFLDYWKELSLVTIAIIALGAFAYFFRSWRAGLAAVALVAVVFAVGHIDKRGYQRRAAEELAAMQRVATARAETIRALEAADEQARARQAALLAELEQLREQIDRPRPGDDQPCGDDGSFTGLGDIR